MVFLAGGHDDGTDAADRQVDNLGLQFDLPLPDLEDFDMFASLDDVPLDFGVPSNHHEEDAIADVVQEEMRVKDSLLDCDLAKQFLGSLAVDKDSLFFVGEDVEPFVLIVILHVFVHL